MIIIRSPLRITLGGGGTDLPSYYNKFDGFVISAAINKYVYVSVTKPFKSGIYLKYSMLENRKKLNQVKHPIIREALKLQSFKHPQIEIVTLTDIPSGTGLGSSGSFTTALLKGLFEFKKEKISKRHLAEIACDIEINLLKQPCGKQDQYISSYGGINCFTFKKDKIVSVKPLNISSNTYKKLQKNLLLFFTGFSRSSSSILKTQDNQSKINKSSMIKNLHFVKKLGFQSRDALLKGDMKKFADLMNVHWNFKKKRSSSMTNPKIDKWYNLALKNGAVGGKLVGAGGGGFLMFYASDVNKLKKKMVSLGLVEVPFDFDYSGTSMILR